MIYACHIVYDAAPLFWLRRRYDECAIPFVCHAAMIFRHEPIFTRHYFTSLLRHATCFADFRHICFSPLPRSRAIAIATSY